MKQALMKSAVVENKNQNDNTTPEWKETAKFESFNNFKLRIPNKNPLKSKTSGVENKDIM